MNEAAERKEHTVLIQAADVVTNLESEKLVEAHKKTDEGKYPVDRYDQSKMKLMLCVQELEVDHRKKLSVVAQVSLHLVKNVGVILSLEVIVETLV